MRPPWKITFPASTAVTSPRGSARISPPARSSTHDPAWSGGSTAMVALAASRMRNALAALDLRHHVVHDRLVERGLFACEVAVDLHLDLLGQVGDDRAVRLEAPQHEGPGDATERAGSLVVTIALDGHGESLAEADGLSQQPGVADLHDRPPSRGQASLAP